VGDRSAFGLTCDPLPKEKSEWHMVHDRYVVLKVVYDRPAYERSLERVAPELREAGLTIVEDRAREPQPFRTWAGVVDEVTFRDFADAWHLDRKAARPGLTCVPGNGWLATRSYTFDGMDWEANGESPIVYVSLTVTVLPARSVGARLPIMSR
jgi:hypothetical protein